MALQAFLLNFSGPNKIFYHLYSFPMPVCIRLLSIALFISLTGYGQSPVSPVVEWEKLLGGSISEKAGDLLPKPNGDIVAVGRSFSNDGDVSDHHCSTDTADGWVVKLNSSGDIL